MAIELKKKRLSEHLTYLDSVRELAIIFVFEVKELDGIRVLLRKLPSLQALLDGGQSVESSSQVGGKDHNDQSLHPLVVDHSGHLVLEECHQHVLLVVQFVVRVILVNSTGHKSTVQPRSVLCKLVNGLRNIRTLFK